MDMAFLIVASFLSVNFVSALPEFDLSNLDKSNLDTNYYFKRDCKCIKFKECKNIIGMVVKAHAADRTYLFEKIRKSTCGLAEGQPMVCCPTQSHISDEAYSIEIVEDQPWVWDAGKLFSNHNRNYPKKNTKKIVHKINYDFEEFEGYEVNLIDFEDPHTKKNCPPIFFDVVEDDIDLSSKHKHFKPYDPNEYNSFDATYGYPPPSGFKFSHLDTTTASTTQKSVINRNEAIDSSQEFPNADYCGVSVNTRIIGGRNSGPGQFPWIARVGYRNKTSNRLSYRCAGSVISGRYIITAAHCVTNLVDDLELSHIRIGEVREKRRRDCETNPILCRIPQDYDIERIIAHPNYDSPKYANDIALIRIFKPDGSVPLTPICLPFNNLALLDEELTGRLAIVAGWSSNIAGTNNPSDLTTTSNRKPSLQYVRLPIVNRTECAATYAQFSANSWTPIYIQESQICVQGRENMDACQGDSGGPLMDDGTREKSFRYTLLGLVSFGPRTCGVSNFPGVYTKVVSFIDWILANMKS